jgi:hypothetical protein
MFRFQSIDHSWAKIKARALGLTSKAATRASIFIDRRDVYAMLLACLMGLIGLGIGLLYGTYRSQPSITIEDFALGDPKMPLEPVLTDTIAPQTPYTDNQSPPAVLPPKQPKSKTQVLTPVQEKTQKTYVASKSGTKYHLPTCLGARSITEANKVWFSTKAEAEKAGYSPARNCKGI